ncbi:lysine 5,6-aminomutase reactivase ATPase KamC [Sporanaerobacter acetigenes]|uniref:lysine 5,6-aminomutase reactivase ATPase KamC n=1 Tax=Sporanaerobacter acetigenes TaxID=165813 RepID=UPI00104861E7|nr:DNA mismatch repair protein MutS [Sporanaerobacter acetigenes]
MDFLDELTRESIDFDYVLSKIRTRTPYGKGYKEEMRPFLPGEESELKEELKRIECIIKYVEDNHFRREIEDIFAHVKDLRTSVKRTMEGCVLTEVELFEIKSFLFLIRELESLLKKYEIDTWKDIDIKSIPKLEKLLDPEDTGIATFYIYDSYSENLKSIREKKKKIEKKIKSEKKELKGKIKKDLKLDIRPDGTLVVSKEDIETIKSIENYPHLTYVSESYMNVKFALKPTEEINELERKVFILKEREEKEEYSIREKISGEIASHRKKLFRNMASIGKLDLILGKAQFATEIHGTKPKISEDHYLYIEEGRHPKVEEFLSKKNLKFTPISIELKEGVTCITGANMGGKTVSLRLSGLLCAMAQYGLFVPAKKMKLGLNFFIRASIGDMQSTDSGLSTFGGEIKLVQDAVEKSHKRGLILIDELARGTNPEEGYAISKAVVKFLKDKTSITLITTHYDNIADIDGVEHLQVVGLSKIDFDKLNNELTDKNEDKMDIINKYMDYRLKKVKHKNEVPRDALNIARLMGLDKCIIKDAEKILEEK